MADKTVEVLTIGHSTQSYEAFLALLRKAEVTALGSKARKAAGQPGKHGV
ncbi:MAG TPA: hypothetical protein VL101_06710 [Nordella sp.]|nr:hypothetical protein [Nordella sp.]